MNDKVIKVMIVLIIIIGFIFLLYRLNYKKVDPNELELFGNIEIRQVDLSFRINGQIKTMLYEEGDKVKKGQLLAILDDKQYKAEYLKSIAQVRINESLRDNALSKYEMNHSLCEDGTISKLECKNLLNKRNETEANLSASEAQSIYAKNNLNDTQLFAPDDGIITTRIKEAGAVISPSDPIYTLTKTNPIWVRAYVSEKNLGNLKYGMKAIVSTDSIDPITNKKRIYNAWVGYISPVAEFTPKTVETTDLRTDLVYRIRVYINNTDDFLRQGMPVTIKILLNNNNDINIEEQDDK